MISICVTIKNRYSLFANSVDSIRASINHLSIPIELIVTDWHSTDKPILSWLPGRAGAIDFTVVPLPDKPFSRGRGLNAAASVAKHPVLFFSDADMLLDRSIILHALSSVAHNKAYFPICWSYGDPGHTKGRYRTGGKGVVGLSRELYIKCDKWDELTEWGSEDIRLFNRVSALAEIERPMELALKHQWHPTTILRGTPK